MFIDSNVKKVFFTADTHFGHNRIIKYCNRPFANKDEMDEALIANWNAKVKDGDVVFHLGDFSFYNDTVNIVRRLNGTIFVVPGNHDRDSLDKAVKDLLAENHKQTKLNILPSLFEVDIQVKDKKIKFVLCHYAMKVWNKHYHGAIHLYGHSHGTLPDDPQSRSMDVGVDCHDYAPIHLNEVLARMYNKTYNPTDHYNGDKRD